MLFLAIFPLLAVPVTAMIIPLFEELSRERVLSIGSDSVPSFLKPDTYIVVFNDDVSTPIVDEHVDYVREIYSTEVKAEGVSDVVEDVLSVFTIGPLKGYVAHLPGALVSYVESRPEVKSVEKDSVMRVSEFDVQKDAPWGVARISERRLNSPPLEYLYDNEGGKGVTAYVIDTGVKVLHPDFEGRATWGKLVAFPYVEVDGNGHGSHVAGTIGGKTYGVAKSVDIVAVGVMSLFGTGLTSDIIKGIEFAVSDHTSKVNAKTKGYKGATINMSLGGDATDVLDLAVNAAVKAGVHVALAAGNENADACGVSPARASGPITVGATDVNDQLAEFSNWGKCVDIQAPGVDILSVGIFADTASLSGTSMASPHVAGLLSYYLSLQPDLDSEFGAKELVSPAELKKRVIKFGTKGLVSGLDKDTPNVLAYNGAGGDLTDFWK